MALRNVIAALSVKLSSDTKGFESGINKSRKHLTGMQKQLRSLKNMLVGAFAVGGIIKFGESALEVADIQQKAEAKLKQALEGRLDVYARLKQQAADLQKITMFGDESTIEAQAQLATYLGANEKAIRSLTPLIQDMATVLGMDLSAAAALVGKSLGSSTNALSRYGIEITGAVGSSARLESAVKSLSDKFKGQAKVAAETGLGPLKQLSNIWGDMKENIAGALIPTLSVLSGAIKKMVETTVEDLKKEKEELNVTVLAVTGLAEGTRERKKALEELKTSYPAYFGNIDTEKTKNTELIELLKQANDEYAKKIIIKEYSDELGKVAKQEEKLESKRISHVKLLNQLAENYNIQGKTLDELREKFHDIAYDESWDKFRNNLGKGVVEGIKNALTFLDEYVGKLEAIGAQKTEIEAAKQKLMELLSLTSTSNSGGIPSTPSTPPSANIKSTNIDPNKFNYNILPDNTQDISTLKTQMSEVKMAALDMSSGIEKAFEDSVVSLSEFIGDAFSGSADLNSMFDVILSQFGQFAVSMGKMLVAYGISMEGFKKAFTNPYAAVASGAALIVVGSMIKNAATSPNISGSSAGVSSSSVSSYSNYNSTPSTQTIELVWKRAGKDLVAIIDTENYVNRVLTARGK